MSEAAKTGDGRNRRRLIVLAGQLFRTLGFVWRAGPVWAVANGILIVARAVLPLLFLYTIKLLVDCVTEAVGVTDATASEDDVSRMFLLVGFACAVSLLQSLTKSASRWICEAQAQAVTDHMFGVMHDKSNTMDLGFFEDPGYRDHMHRAQREAPTRPTHIVNSLQEVLVNAVTLLTIAGLLASYSWWSIPVVVLASVPGAALRLRYSSDYFYWGRSATYRERMSLYLNKLLTDIDFSKEIRIFGIGKILKGRFEEIRSGIRSEKLTVTRRRAMADFAGEALSVVGVFGLLAAMGHSALTGAITIGTLVMLHGGLQKAWACLSAALRGTAMLYEDTLFFSELFEFLDLESRISSPESPRPLPPVKESAIRLEGVRFKYPHDERRVLNDIDLDIAPGEHVAIVGHNGCGKTTLVKLLCRLYDPTDGKILLGDTDLRDLDIGEYRASIGVLLQDFCRYQMTLRENVWLGDVTKEPEDPRVMEAIRGANLEKLVDQLPEGIDSMLGATFLGGAELSTGQWQVVSLARMLLRDAPILILDEPTSALDPKAEDLLIRTLRRVAQGSTAVVISHRLAAIQGMDRILYMDDGRVAESGTHAELMALGGGYATLYEMQSRHYR